jgi:predicted ATPase
LAATQPSGDRFTIITGGPGAGKTSLIEELRRRGFAGTQEAGRAIVRDQTLIGGRALHTADNALFAELMLAWEMRSYRIAEEEPGRAVFFDRAIPELTGYLRMLGRPVPAHMAAAARVFRYRPRVFVAPQWPEIYATDAERKQEGAGEGQANGELGVGGELGVQVAGQSGAIGVGDGGEHGAAWP